MKGYAKKLLVIALAATALSACGGDDDDDGFDNRDGSATGEASVSVTDAAVDGANRVVVEFSAVELKPQSGESQLFELPAPQQIDLLTLQGAEFEPLIMDEEVPAGNYEWIRLHVNDNECGALEPGTDPTGSFIELSDGGIEPLFIPSGSQTGLKLVSGFTIAAGGHTDLVVDFDLRKSVTKPQGQDCHFLKPALRVVDNAEVGHIAGTVSGTSLDASCADLDPNVGKAVYLFAGANAAVDDIDAEEPEPVTTAIVSLNEETAAFEYEIGFVLEGDYTIALTCDADLDDPETDDDDSFTFVTTQNVSVEADQTTTADF